MADGGISPGSQLLFIAHGTYSRRRKAVSVSFSTSAMEEERCHGKLQLHTFPGGDDLGDRPLAGIDINITFVHKDHDSPPSYQWCILHKTIIAIDL